MPEAVAVALAGAAAGLVLAVLLLRRSVVGEARGRFESWRATELSRVRAGAVQGQRAAVKARLSTEFLAGAPFTAADARFLGDPVTLVVFDGLSTGEPGAVVFVGGDESGVVAECVGAGRVEWATLVLRGSAS